MPPKKKIVKSAASANAADDDMAFLDAQIAANTNSTAAAATATKATTDTDLPPPPPTKASTVIESAEADGDDQDDDNDGDENAGAKKDKKKKKKKGAKKDATTDDTTAAATATTTATATAAPKSAQARAILERQQKQKAEEARLQLLQAEADRKAAEEEQRQLAEERAIEEEKEKKRKMKEDKKSAQKAAGTYLTKAEKEKKRKQEERLKMLQASGLLPTQRDPAAAAPSQADMYKKPQPQQQQQQQAKAITTTEEEVVVNDGSSRGSAGVESVAAAAAAVSKPATSAATTTTTAINSSSSGVAVAVKDDWDADEDDDWELNLDRIDLDVKSRKEASEEDVEDLLELERKQEQQNLKLLGIERAKRDEELRIKREAEEHLRAEMERSEREAAMRKENSRKNRIARDAAARAARKPDNLRAPISCIMGHVDTGKTSLLDKIRHTNVQEGEAGGITQQIGVTQFAKETLATQTQCLQQKHPFKIELPGLLVIDTPGHESFSNLRSRGSSLCDIAILVIDLMHTLEPQTIESINLLKKSRTPFIVALNKVDRCYGWKSTPNAPIRDSLAQQDENCRLEFKDRSERAIVALMQQGLNAKLYWENDDPAHTVSLVPTSAITGEGVPDVLMLLITLTQLRLREQLMYMELLQCTVLEVKVIEGLGHTVDVVLVNGTLKEGDTVVLSTMDGPVVTTIRALLTPPPSREMRVKSEYIHHSSISGAIGVKIVASDVGRVIAGTSVLVVRSEDDLEDVKEDVQTDIAKVQKALQTDNRGVMVHASTLGALEALMQFLREECKPPIPVCHVNIGPVHKKDVMRAAIMHQKQLPEYASILVFDCSVDAEAREMAEEENVRVFSADIIYHLFDQFTAYMARLRDERKKKAQDQVVFPAVLKILPQYIFNKKDPIVIGVEVVEGTLRVNTPLCVPQLGLDIGRVTSIQINHKEATVAKKAAQCSIRISCESNPTLYYGRQFDHTNTLYSKISRASIDACKEFFADEMAKDDWQLIVKLKKVFNIS